MKKAILIIFTSIFLFSTCALEIANIIGPGGGYVFYDKGNYDNGWRYIECSSYDIGEVKDISQSSIERAWELCSENSGGWYRFEWELPQESDLRKILECFSYGLTRFSPDYHYLAVNRFANYDPADPATWEAVVLHKNFDTKANGEVEKVTEFDNVIRIRPIRRF